MNFLSHYVFNHDVLNLPRDVYFAMGVALPDIWPRFSRRKRIRWAHVVAATPPTLDGAALREGLLNHAAADRAFHALPLFATWQRAVQSRMYPRAASGAVRDFLAHIAIELALDYRLLGDHADLAERFYAELESCPPAHVAQLAETVAGVATAGLAEVLDQFLARRFLRRYREPGGIGIAIRRVFEITTVASPAAGEIEQAVQAAIDIVDPRRLWPALLAAWSGGAAPGRGRAVLAAASEVIRAVAADPAPAAERLS